MRELSVYIPFLPDTAATGYGARQRRPQGEEKKWRDYIAAEWEAVGCPKFYRLQVTLTFALSGSGTGTLVDYLAASSKLVGEAIAGLPLSDGGQAHVTSWHFGIESRAEPRTTIRIEEGRKGCEAYRRPDCNLYETCNTPLCPLDQISLNGIWYSDEETCRSRTYGNLTWIQAQRKLAKVNAGGYFTVGMLNRLFLVRQGVSGLDPNLPQRHQLRAWFQKRAERKDAAPEERAARSRHLKNFSFKKQGGEEA